MVALIGTAVVLVIGGMAVLPSLSLIFGRGDAADEPLPPSERGDTAPTTVAPGGPSLNRDEFGIVGEGGPDAPAELYNEISCTFTGTSVMEPPIPFSFRYRGGPHSMGLEPGARFDCTDGTKEESAGRVSIDATFEEMGIFNGVATGTGRIEWEAIGAKAGVGPSVGMASNTLVEIELDVPVIVVWTTILDGPYEGYKGRLVLEGWVQITDSNGDITGVRFQPTAATFGTS